MRLSFGIEPSLVPAGCRVGEILSFASVLDVDEYNSCNIKLSFDDAIFQAAGPISLQLGPGPHRRNTIWKLKAIQPSVASRIGLSAFCDGNHQRAEFSVKVTG